MYCLAYSILCRAIHGLFTCVALFSLTAPKIMAFMTIGLMNKSWPTELLCQ